MTCSRMWIRRWRLPSDRGPESGTSPSPFPRPSTPRRLPEACHGRDSRSVLEHRPARYPGSGCAASCPGIRSVEFLPCSQGATGARRSSPLDLGAFSQMTPYLSRTGCSKLALLSGSRRRERWSAIGCCSTAHRGQSDVNEANGLRFGHRSSIRATRPADCPQRQDGRDVGPSRTKPVAPPVPAREACDSRPRRRYRRAKTGSPVCCRQSGFGCSPC